MAPQDLETHRGDLASIRRVDFDDLVADREDSTRSNDAEVLDVRGAAEFALGHLSGATNIAHTRLAVEMPQVSPGRTIWVHCQSGRRAALASALLAREGHDVAWVADVYRSELDGS